MHWHHNAAVGVSLVGLYTWTTLSSWRTTIPSHMQVLSWLVKITKTRKPKRRRLTKRICPWSLMLLLGLHTCQKHRMMPVFTLHLIQQNLARELERGRRLSNTNTYLLFLMTLLALLSLISPWWVFNCIHLIFLVLKIIMCCSCSYIDDTFFALDNFSEQCHSDQPPNFHREHAKLLTRFLCYLFWGTSLAWFFLSRLHLIPTPQKIFVFL